ncbi:hypothetical protein [Rhizobium flavescens]|uniref:hypothetical protein n=1 Tax=Rhizobium flavescens TaxID=2607407 RepID=UPI0018D7E5F9
MFDRPLNQGSSTGKTIAHDHAAAMQEKDRGADLVMAFAGDDRNHELISLISRDPVIDAIHRIILQQILPGWAAYFSEIGQPIERHPGRHEIAN